MKRMQLDTVDIFARDNVQKLIILAKRYKGEFLEEDQEKILEEVLTVLADWKGNMTVDSIAASVFSVREYLFAMKLFQNYDMDEEVRMALLSFIHFDQFLFKRINRWYDNPNADLGEKWCLNEENKKFSEKACVYNLVMALTESHKYLKRKFGPDKNKWKWGFLHTARYNHLPFSDTPLRFLYHREFAAPGNKRTVNVHSWYMLFHEFKGIHSANYRMVTDMSPQGKSYYVIDSGISENFMSPNYDDQQRLHRRGDYLEMKFGVKYLREFKNMLFIVPTKPENTTTTKANGTAKKN